MRTALTAIAVLTGILGLATTASAQEASSPGSSEGFGRRASNIIVLDDVLGYVDQSFKVKEGGEEESVRSSGPEYSSGTGFFPSRVIRLGYHYAMDNGLTLGSGVGVWYAKETSGEDDKSSVLHLEARPRIGYALPLTPAFAFWPRAGVGYWHRTMSGGDDDLSLWALTADIDVLCVISPAPHFGITGGLKFSIPMTGGASSGGDSIDGSHTMTSLALGLLTDF